MKRFETSFDGLYILEPNVFGDQRGYFLESYNQNTLRALGINNNFVQDNESHSSFGALRGLHFQQGDKAQAKLVRVVEGAVLDVVVDLRKNSSTFGKHLSLELSRENRKMLMIPRGFAHGFVVLSPTALFHYKCDNYYSKAHESGILWNDPDLKIDWMIDSSSIILSEKDSILKPFKSLELNE